jgi:hypothetical protein
MSPQQAISIMESLEKDFRVLKWRARCRSARLTNPGDTRAFEVIEPYDCRSEATFDPIGGRYSYRQCCTSELYGGDDPFLSTISHGSFDGEFCRELLWSEPGITLPDPQTSWGSATVSRPASLRDAWDTGLKIGAFELGLAYMPPYFHESFTDYPIQPFSAVVRTWVDEGKEVSIAEEDTGEWIVCVKLNVGGGCSAEDPHMFRIAYDPTRRGAVIGSRVIAREPTGEYHRDICRSEIDLLEAAGGFWVPNTIKGMCADEQMNLTSMTITSLEAVEVNPSVTAETFRLDFPKGVHVHDAVNKVSYVEGEPIDHESAQRIFLNGGFVRIIEQTQ